MLQFLFLNPQSLVYISLIYYSVYLEMSEELREHMILPTDVIFLFGSFWEWAI